MVPTKKEVCTMFIKTEADVLEFELVIIIIIKH